jgi:4,5-dihydroxyphthalate decarboxylase
MVNLSLSAAFTGGVLAAAVLDGAVVPEGISWTCSKIHPSELYWRQLRYGDFDVSEMSISSLLIAVAQGNREWTAIPVFTRRRFFHTQIVVRDGSDIKRPQDLAGRNVGLAEYQQTSAVWARAALQHEFGVTPGQVQWFMERPAARSHGGLTEFTPPDGVALSYIPEDSSIAGMLASGGLDAALTYTAGDNLVDRTNVNVARQPGVSYLFDDRQAEVRRYHDKTGLLPVNHCVVIRTSVIEAHPWVTLNVYTAFLRAKERAIAAASAGLAPWTETGMVPSSVARELAKTDPSPYGLARQRGTLDTLAGYLAEQGLTRHQVDIGQVFAACTLDL